MKLLQFCTIASIAFGFNTITFVETAVAQIHQESFSEAVLSLALSLQSTQSNQTQTTPVAQRPSSAQTVEEQIAEADRLMNQANQQYQTSRYREAIQSWQRALEICRDSAVRRTYPEASRSCEAGMLSNLGLVYDDLSQYDQAIDYLQQALPIFRAVADRKGEAIALNSLGSVYDALSQYDQAIDYFQQALPIYREVSHRKGEAMALNNLGVAYDNLSQHDQAIDYYQQALPIYREVSDRGGEADVLLNLGVVYWALGRSDQATDYYQQALPIFRAVENRNGEAKVLMNLGLIDSSLGQYDRAIDYYQQALPILREVGDRDTEAALLSNIGRLYAAQNSPVSAIQQLQKAVEVWQAIRTNLRGLPQADQQAYTDSIADDYRILADLLRQQGRNREAQAVLNLL